MQWIMAGKIKKKYIFFQTEYIHMIINWYNELSSNPASE